ncbi:MAG: hypothetical protein R2850_13370 [Bacteroidia bacterium]
MRLICLNRTSSNRAKSGYPHPASSDACASGLRLACLLLEAHRPTAISGKVYEQGSSQASFSAEGNTLIAYRQTRHTTWNVQLRMRMPALQLPEFDTPEILSIPNAVPFYTIYPQPFRQTFVIQSSEKPWMKLT